MNQTIGRTHSRHDLLSDYNENDSTTIVQETEGRITMKQNRRYSFEQQEGTKKQTNDSITDRSKNKKEEEEEEEEDDNEEANERFNTDRSEEEEVHERSFTDRPEQGRRRQMSENERTIRY